MCKSLKIDVFGRHVLAEKSQNGWKIYFLSGDGKKRRADEMRVPSFVTEDEIEPYLADLCHEWQQPNIRMSAVWINLDSAKRLKMYFCYS